MPLVHPLFVYQRHKADGRKLKVGFHVDVAAALNVYEAFNQRGYRLGDLLFNYPPQQGEPRELMTIDKSRFARDDLILTSTRFDTDAPDSKDLPRKRVQRGFTDLEAAIVAQWRERFGVSRRLLVKLDPDYADAFATGFENRFAIQFLEGEGAPYGRLSDADDSNIDKDPPEATTAYVLRLRELYPGGPGYLGFFGMCSTTTLLWSHLLRFRHADLLHDEGFTIAEIAGAVPKREPDMRWADGWKSQIILRA
jgi:hypothetical protein